MNCQLLHRGRYLNRESSWTSMFPGGDTCLNRKCSCQNKSTLRHILLPCYPAPSPSDSSWIPLASNFAFKACVGRLIHEISSMRFRFLSPEAYDLCGMTFVTQIIHKFCNSFAVRGVHAREGILWVLWDRLVTAKSGWLAIRYCLMSVPKASRWRSGEQAWWHKPCSPDRYRDVSITRCAICRTCQRMAILYSLLHTPRALSCCLCFPPSEITDCELVSVRVPTQLSISIGDRILGARK